MELQELGAITLTGIYHVARPDDEDNTEPFENPGDLNDLVPMVLDARGKVIRAADPTDPVRTLEELATAREFVEHVPARILGKHGREVRDEPPVDNSKALSSKHANALVREIFRRTITLANIRKVMINSYLYAKPAIQSFDEDEL